MVDLKLESVRYGAKHRVAALDGFEFHCPDGGTAVIAGKSGSGKTTLLNVIAGLHRDFSGTRSVSGKVAYMPQKNCLPPWRTAEGQIKLADKNADASGLLRRAGLSGYEKRYPSGLSGGQYRRLALCQSLAFKPDILLADEPFSALDADTKTEIISWIKELRRDYHPFALVCVTHDEEEVLSLGGEVIQLTVDS